MIQKALIELTDKNNTQISKSDLINIRNEL